MKAKTLMTIGFVLVVVGMLLYYLTPVQLKREWDYEVQWGTSSRPTLYPYDQWKRDVEILASIRSVGAFFDLIGVPIFMYGAIKFVRSVEQQR